MKYDQGPFVVRLKTVLKSLRVQEVFKTPKSQQKFKIIIYRNVLNFFRETNIGEEIKIFEYQDAIV